MFHKCGLYALSFVAVSIGFSTLFSDVSNAASIYDNVYHHSPDLPIKSQSYYGVTCEAVSVSTDWSSYILDEEKFPSNSTQNEQAYLAKESFLQALDTGRWGVSIGNTWGGGGYYSFVYVYWTEDDSLALNWSEDYLTTSYVNTAVIVNHSIAYGGSDCTPVVYSTNLQGTNSATVSSFGGYKENPSNFDDSLGFSNNLIYTDHPNYPTDYEGPEIVESTVDNRETIKPDFKGSVNDKIINMNDKNNKLPKFTPDEGYSFEGYKVEWSLTSCTIDENTPSVCRDSDLIDHQILSQGDTYTYSVNDYNTYQLTAQYLVEQCYRYPSYPATPDYCFYVDLNTEFEDYQFLPVSRNLDIDGSIILVDTELEDCDISGFCETKKGNDLFDYFEDRDDFGLTAILLSPILFYQQLPGLANNCTPITFSWNSQVMSLPCVGNSMQIWSPTAYGIYHAVVNAVVAYYVALGIFKTIKSINDPKDDRIEVTTL